MKYQNQTLNLLQFKIICYVSCVFCHIHRLFVYLRMQMSISKQHSCVQRPLRECRSILSGAFGLPYYCTPLVCISDVALWRYNKPKTKNQQDG